VKIELAAGGAVKEDSMRIWQSPRRPRQLAVLVSALVLVAVALPSSASAQASRTWVSGVGDDANPCSRTAPCRSFAGAIGNTVVGGEINAIDSGPYGTVSINKSITIDGNGHHASILGSASAGITVNAAPSDKVIIRDLRINGVRRTIASGLSGIRFFTGGTLRVQNTVVFGFQNDGILMLADDAPRSRLIVTKSSIHDNGTGIRVDPEPSGVARATIRRSEIDDNGDGLIADTTTGGRASLYVFDSAISDNGIDSSVFGRGILSNGSRSRAVISGNEIHSNRLGLRALNGGQILSGGDNRVFGNITNGSRTGTWAKM
jgi:hypothetical protein